VLGSVDSLVKRERGGELVTGAGRIPRDPGPAREVCAGSQGVGVFRAQDSLADREQGGELVTGAGRIPRRSGEVAEVGAGGQGVRVLGA
jgi:hypothetical protein